MLEIIKIICIYILSANIIGITVDWLQSSHLFVFLALSEHFKTSLQMSSIRLPLRTGDVNLYLSLPSVTTSGVTSDRLPTKSFSLCDTHYIRKVIIKLLLEYCHNTNMTNQTNPKNTSCLRREVDWLSSDKHLQILVLLEDR